MAGDIFVISDLHLGDGGPRDQFSLGGRALELERFIVHVGKQGGELFVLGDLFELWQMNLSRILQVNRRLLDGFADVGALYVPGNHDVDLVHFVGTDDLSHPFFRRMALPFSRQIGGKTFQFFHGHEVDPFNSGDDPGWGRMLTVFAGIFEEENGSPLLASGEQVETVLMQFGDSMLQLWAGMTLLLRRRLVKKHGANPDMNRSLTPAQNPDLLSEHVKQVRGHLDALGGDIAVLGHTHKPGHIDGWYFNSGTWTGNDNPFLRITPTGEVAYHLWVNGQAEERPMPVAWAPAPEKHIKLPRPVVAARETLGKLFPNAHLHRAPPAKKWLVGQGLLAIAGGILAILFWGHLERLILLFGCYTLASAVLDIVAAMQERSLLLRVFDYVRAGVSVLFGAVTLLRPSFSVSLLFFLIGAWALGWGCLRLAEGTLLGTAEGRVWNILSGVATALMGLILMTFPGRNLLTLSWVLWGWTLLAGVSQIIAGLWGVTRIPRRLLPSKWRAAQAGT